MELTQLGKNKVQSVHFHLSNASVGVEDTCQFWKQTNKTSFQMSFYVYNVLGQNVGEQDTFWII